MHTYILIFQFARNGKDVLRLEELSYSILWIIVQTFTTRSRSQLQFVDPPTTLSVSSAFLCQKSECLKYTIELLTKSFTWAEIGGILTLFQASVSNRNAKAALNQPGIF